MLCPSCKTENVSEAKFCRQCGRGIGSGKPPGRIASWVALIMAILIDLTAFIVICYILAEASGTYIRGDFEAVCGWVLFFFLVSFASLIPALLRAGLGTGTGAQKRTTTAVVLILLGMAALGAGIASASGMAVGSILQSLVQ